jgi:ABC-type multidrug transport system ATPase subunit
MHLRVAVDGVAVAELEPPGPHAIGRAGDAEIRVRDLRVSRRHGELDVVSGVWRYTDTASAGGTWRDGQRVERFRVDGAARLTLGATDGVEVVLEPVTGVAPPEPAPESHTKPGVGPVLVVPPASTAGVQRIGRSGDNDLVLPELVVSRHHAELHSGADHCVVLDLSSHHGTFVDGARVEGSATLGPESRVTIGSTRLHLVDGCLAVVSDDEESASLVADGVTVTLDGARIVDGVDFVLSSGTLLAIVGPTGAGKSSLVKALTGVRPPDAGAVLVGGADLYQAFDELRLTLGYVPQDDILHPQLNARAALRFGAELRFPPETSTNERERRVEEVLAELGLLDRADLVIAKLSGGQRKRTSVALELLTKPSLLFLDEPTSGLDPGYEQAVMLLLRELADEGRTVVVVTHALANLALCDQVLVLAPGGRAVYDGPPAGLLDHFGAADHAAVFRALENADRSPAARTAKARSDALSRPRQERSGRPVAPPAIDWRAQVAMLVRRQFAVLLADRRNLAFLAAAAVVPALLILTIIHAGAFNADADGPVEGARELVGVLVVTAAALGAANGLREIVKEQAIYRRERAVGLSRAAYLASKMIALGAVTAVQCVVLVLLGTASADGPGGSNVFPPIIEVAFDVTLVGVVSLALGLLISSFVSSSEKAMALIPVVFVVSWLFSGVSVDLQRRAVMRDVAYVVPANWGVSALASTVDLPELAGCGQGAAGPTSSIPTSGVVATRCDANWAPGLEHWSLDVSVLLLLGAALMLAADWALARKEPTDALRRDFLIARGWRAARDQLTIIGGR